ncbi:hypothetical protein JOE66_002136 [Subtercola frigoramans]|uniref:Uncharacterized protein n=1 Tax=Subtercola frigoramans TaxID=120298 RepID=A0ABS2L609_9MICO|nr:hypothetical protein [Subtercola frigoramans]
MSVEPEPQCWREYTGPQGTVQTLKPDLSAVTASGDFEDHWFIEADEGTEHLPQILAKCRSYASYAASGIEQHRLGVFPAVVWVTKDGARAASLSRAVASTPGLPVELFRFTTTENFIALITSGGAP